MLETALGQVLARDIAAPIDLPSYTNSAMDGFALHSASVAGASGQQPVRLHIAGAIEAGGYWSGSLGVYDALRINTGAAVPAGCDAIVPIEAIEEQGEYIQISEPVEPGRHIRLVGEDIRKEATALRRGVTLRSQEIGLLAALGFASVEVVPIPRIAILSTGPELLASATPSTVNDVNGPMLACAVREAGGHVSQIDCTDGTIEHLRALIEARAGDSDLIIATGGISNSPADTVAMLLSSTPDGELWQVRLRPGKHFGIGQFGQTTLLALPGNPIAAYVGFELLVRPAIDWLAGKPIDQNTVIARLIESVQGASGRTDAIRGRGWVQEDGMTVVTPVGNRGSGVISSLVEANCLIILPETISSQNAGELARVHWIGRR